MAFARPLRVVLSAVVAGVLAAAAAGSGAAVDLELVLAVDGSWSVNEREFGLQMAGYAAAFRDPRLVGAIEAAGDSGVAVCLLQWSGPGMHSLAVDWRVIRNSADALALADVLAATPRVVPGGSTAIGEAIGHALRLFSSSGFRARRRTIDVSGDGSANDGADQDWLPALARDRAVAAGVTVNGLAILNEEPDLDAYYADQVVGGPSAFVMAVADYDDFADAILRKLIREILGGPIATDPGSIYARIDVADAHPGTERPVARPRPQ